MASAVLLKSTHVGLYRMYGCIGPRLKIHCGLFFQVYERSDWRTIAMARSSSPLCSSFQTAWSTEWDQLISVQLQLTESERLC